jgi:hypothetical protein
LLGYNLSMPEDYEKARSKDLFTTVCPKFVADSVSILETILGK